MFKRIFDTIKSIFEVQDNVKARTKCLKDSIDDRDLLKLTTSKPLQEENFSLSSYAPPITNQQDTGACVGFALSTALYILIKRMLKLSNREHMSIAPLSATWIYYFARQIEGKGLKDEGVSLRNGMKALKDNGATLSSVMSNSYRVDKHPSDSILASKVFKISAYYRIPYSVNIVEELKTILSTEQLPITLGVKLFRKQIYNAKWNGGYLNYNQQDIDKDESLGGHAICMTGYKTDKNGELWFECINSWGLYGNTKGYLYLPASVFSSDNYHNYIVDIWTFSKRYF